jgi:phosphoacetylglucosamine mutase
MDKTKDVTTLDAGLFGILKAEGRAFTYGSAGFRYHSKFMRPITLRVGLFMGALAKYYWPKALGIVVTASHNPIKDNGLKLINTHGEMLDQKYEPLLNELMKTEDLTEGLAQMRKSLAEIHSHREPSANGVLFLGRDTRPHGVELLEHITTYSDCRLFDFGMVSTPIVYYNTWYFNKNGGVESGLSVESLMRHYFVNMAGGFERLMARHFKRKRFNLYVDCANGVGSLMLARFKESQLYQRYNPVIIYGEDFDRLNEQCGSEYVTQKSVATEQFASFKEDDLINLSFCFDGDADRLICYTLQQSKFVLIDGARICTVFAKTINHLMTAISEHLAGVDEPLRQQFNQLTLGVVYTAYSNSAFVEYITNHLQLNSSIAETGVKYLHEKATQYDMGLYFEWNGHGAIVISEHIHQLLDQLVEASSDPTLTELLLDFRCYLTCQNHINGDALTNLMTFLASLEILDLSLSDVDGMYKDYESITTAIPLKDRALMKSSQDERILLYPADIQPQIDELMKSYPKHRCFVRGSGTEDLARVFVEGPNKEWREEIASKLIQILKTHPKLL